ncbi:hypothetical protein G7Y89_g2213 [Cudoniella acicularis]|uniref:Uncharacterized protein n=1 Tax=Cudoniella acicularis TaxID=354080 RepID=A0A8H4W6P8_9HELO|nr:hypothetical protein G7Y89_g2213 [Cudoniella acicularis]
MERVFLDTLRVKRSHKEKEKNASESEPLIRATLSSIHQTIISATPSSNITSISYPERFKGIPYLTPLTHTAIQEFPGIKDVMQLSPYLNCIRLAYGLNTPEALGYPLGSDLDDYNSLLLHFEYQEYLEVSVMAVTEYANIREEFFRIDDFGGGEMVASSPPSDFLFIIFSGEVMPSEFGKIRKAVVEVVPEFEDRFVDSIEPWWVGAIGAAGRAREFTVKMPVTHIDFQRMETREEWLAGRDGKGG